MRFIVLNRAEAERAKVSSLHAYISLTDSDQAIADLPCQDTCIGTLRLAFDDVLDGREQGRPIIPFTREHAQSILSFWCDVRDRIDTLVIHCNGGQCRSPAVAAALQRIETGEDGHWFKTKRPNIHVYRLLLEEHHTAGEQS